MVFSPWLILVYCSYLQLRVTLALHHLHASLLHFTQKLFHDCLSTLLGRLIFEFTHEVSLLPRKGLLERVDLTHKIPLPARLLIRTI